MKTLQRARLRLSKSLALFALLFALAASPVLGAELTASDGAANDHFGYSVSQSGSIGLVGANLDDIGANSDQGSAYVFRNLNTATGSVTQNVKLTASDGAAGDNFGISVSLSGSIGLVGADLDNIGANSLQGSAYVYRNLNTATGTVTQSAKLTASDGAAFDFFGRSVSLSGSTGLVGASSDDIGAFFNQGSAYVYRNLDTATGSVTQNVKLTASDGTGSDEFGYSVSQSGSIGLVGARSDDNGANTNQGSAYVFRNLDAATGTVTQNVKLTASDGTGSDEFGYSVSQSGSIGLVGARLDDNGANTDQGSAYVFRNLDTATGTVTQNVKLTASDGTGSDEFGYSVSQSGSIGLVGARSDDNGANTNQGSAYVFRNLDTATGTVTQNVKLTASDGAGSDEFGYSVSLDGDQFVIGCYRKNSGTGKAYSGSVASVTTLDSGNTSRTIDGISFESQDDWIIGETTDANAVTLTSGDAATVTASGKKVFIGKNAGSDNNSLTVNGALTATEVVVGASGNAGNRLVVGSFGSVSSAATIVLQAGSELNYNSASSLSVASLIVNGGTLSGTGAVNVAVALDSLTDTLSPGNSPGTQSYGTSQAWSSFTYEWEVSDFTNPTAGTAFDQITIAGNLALDTLNPYVLDIFSLTSGNLAGNVTNFAETNRNWAILSTTGGITGFNAANWNLNTTGFTNADTGAWSLAQSGNDLVLSYTTVPEPSTYALLLVAGCAFWFAKRRFSFPKAIARTWPSTRTNVSPE